MGKAILQCFPDGTSNQLLHYLYVNLQDNNTESALLHVGVNDVLQDSTETINNFFNNVHDMAKKYCSYNMKNVFISGLVIVKKPILKPLKTFMIRW